MNIDTEAIVRLRDHLLADQRTSAEVRTDDVRANKETVDATLRRILPFAELMCVVMAADSEYAPLERQALLKALDVLCDSLVPMDELENLADRFTADFAVGDAENRVLAATARIGMDQEDRDMAFLLAAAVALADNTFADTERTTLEWVREYLGISDRRMNRLLGEN